jgi:hypothetical protein
MASISGLYASSGVRVTRTAPLTDKRQISVARQTVALRSDRALLGGIGRLPLPAMPAGGATVRIRIRVIVPVLVVVLGGVVEIGRRWF